VLRNHHSYKITNVKNKVLIIIINVILIGGANRAKMLGGGCNPPDITRKVTYRKVTYIVNIHPKI